jgi:hypothetical protein
LQVIYAVLYYGIPRMDEHNGYMTRAFNLKKLCYAEYICGFCQYNERAFPSALRRGFCAWDALFAMR